MPAAADPLQTPGRPVADSVEPKAMHGGPEACMDGARTHEIITKEL